jgi:GntR family histidine utilization transcriptional repressor
MHLRIRGFIVQQIRSGQWKPEDRIPSENELKERFAVSRMTVIQAVRDLCKEGVLTRVQGSGSFVAQPQTHLTVVNFFDIAQEIRGRGHRHHAEVIERLRRAATAAEAKQFNLKPGARLFHGLIVHFEDGSPVQLEDRLVNAEAVPDFLSIDHAQTTSFAYLMRLFPYPTGKHMIRSIEATALMREVLRLQPGEPCLEIERTTYIEDTVITVVRLIHPGFRYELSGLIEQR